LHDQVGQRLVLREQPLHPIDRDHEDRAGLFDHCRREQPLSGKQVQLGHELARASGGQLTRHPGLVVENGDHSGDDHDEVVAAVPLAKQLLPGHRRPHLSVTVQQGQLPGAQARSQ